MYKRCIGRKIIFTVINQRTAANDIKKLLTFFLIFPNGSDKYFPSQIEFFHYRHFTNSN